MQKWEYLTDVYQGSTTVKSEVETLVNAHGEDGWELISAISTTDAQGAHAAFMMFFKRPKP